MSDSVDVLRTPNKTLNRTSDRTGKPSLLMQLFGIRSKKRSVRYGARNTLRLTERNPEHPTLLPLRRDHLLTFCSTRQFACLWVVKSESKFTTKLLQYVYCLYILTPNFVCIYVRWVITPPKQVFVVSRTWLDSKLQQVVSGFYQLSASLIETFVLSYPYSTTELI